MLEQPCDKVVYNQQGDDKFVTPCDKVVTALCKEKIESHNEY